MRKRSPLRPRSLRQFLSWFDVVEPVEILNGSIYPYGCSSDARYRYDYMQYHRFKTLVSCFTHNASQHSHRITAHFFINLESIRNAET